MGRPFILVLAVLTLASCAAEEAPAPAPEPAAPVIDRAIGDYTYEPLEFGVVGRYRGRERRMVPRSSGVLRHKSGEPVVVVRFWPHRAAWENGNILLDRKVSVFRTATLEVPGVGPLSVFCFLQTGWPPEQRGQPANPPRRARADLTLLFTGENSLLVLSHTGPVIEVSPTDEPDEKAWHDRLMAEALADADESPVVDALRALISERKLLDTRRIMDGLPRVRASIDGAEYVDLESGPRRDGGRVETFLLSARPGQAVEIEVLAKFRRFRMTTQGLSEEEDPSGSPGALVLRGEEIPFDEGGRAAADLGVLESPRWIPFDVPGLRRSRDRQRLALLLRWGRSEEQWLNSGSPEFPLCPTLQDAGVEAAAGVLSTDLETGYDPDRGGYFAVRGYDQLARPVWAERLVLERVSEEASVDAWLRQIRPGLEEAIDGDLERLDRTAAASVIAELSRIGAGFTRLHGWGRPREVFALALLGKEFPELVKQNPLRGILDRWLEAMKEQPEPMVDDGKGHRRERSPTERACVVAALHLATEAFRDASLREARDAQRARLAALARRAGLHGDGTLEPGNFRRACPLETVAAQGQLAALLGDEEGLASAQQFIVRMLVRGDDRGRSAYELYENASLSVRAGLLAVLRGRPALFEPPPIGR